MNRRQFLITSLISAAAAIAAPALKYLPATAGGPVRYALAEFYRRLLERQLYKGTVIISTPDGSCSFDSLAELIHAR